MIKSDTRGRDWHFRLRIGFGKEMHVEDGRVLGRFLDAGSHLREASISPKACPYLGYSRLGFGEPSGGGAGVA